VSLNGGPSFSMLWKNGGSAVNSGQGN
jgi:hypothetical protein